MSVWKDTFTPFNRRVLAETMCCVLHDGQVRKYTGEPYSNHPKEVAAILISKGRSDEEIIAGFLHDVLEDTDADPDMIEDSFGIDVLRIVQEVTDVSRPEDGNRAARKALDRDHLAQASGKGQNVKYADIISNCLSIRKHDPKFAELYIRECGEALSVMTKGDRVLRAVALSFCGMPYLGDA